MSRVSSGVVWGGQNENKQTRESNRGELWQRIIGRSNISPAALVRIVPVIKLSLFVKTGWHNFPIFNQYVSESNEPSGVAE
jgi:hypothetical protein